MVGATMMPGSSAENLDCQLNVSETHPSRNCTCQFLCGVCADAEAVPASMYGEGQDPIYLDEVDCGGFEQSLLHCPHRGVGVHDCSHFEDASVECRSGKCRHSLVCVSIAK